MTRNEPLTGSRWPDLIPYGSLLVKSSGRMLLISYGSCSSLCGLWHLVGVGVPALVGLLGSVLVTASP